jgi:hypothetical protein
MSDTRSNPDVPLNQFSSRGLDRRRNGIQRNARVGRNARAGRNARTRSRQCHNIGRNLPRQWKKALHWVLIFLLAIFLSYYFFQILVASRPIKFSLLPDAGDANLTVAVLSQVFGALIVWLYLDLCNTLRFQLLARDEGAELLEFEQLSKSTGWKDTFRLFFKRGTHWKWSLQRWDKLRH